MKLLIDANILLDVMQKDSPNRQQFYNDSDRIWKLCETKQVEGYVSTLTIANLVYVMRKELSPEKTNEVVGILSLIFSFEKLSSTDIINASGMKWKDFEDAIQAATAKRIRCNYIITRNIRDFKDSPVPALTPAEFLARL